MFKGELTWSLAIVILGSDGHEGQGQNEQGQSSHSKITESLE